MRRIAEDLIDSAKPYDERDYAGALQWYRRAVEAGDRESRFPLAENLRIAGDLAAAKPLYLELAGEDVPEVVVLLRLGEAYDREGNFEEALLWYRKAALSTNRLMAVYIKPAAQAWTEIEAGLAAAPGTLPHLALKARNRNDAEALFRHALAVAPTDVETARNNLARAASLRHPGATTAYYTDLVRSDRAAAPRWLQSQVENENPQAIYLLGMERAASDRAAGVALIQRAAGLGSLDAKFRVGMMQFQGQGLPPDRAAGLALITEAADAGQPEALITLGTSLIRGDAGVTADPARGLAYLRRAAAQTDHPPVAAQAAKFVQQFEQQHARQTFETLWANPETRLKELVAVYTAAEDKTPAVEFLADKLVPAWRETTVANAFKPIRDVISGHYAVINTMEDAEKEQARWLLYRAVHAARLEAEKAGTIKYPEFLYNWLRPGASL
jgi:TPR repeat protein